MISFPPIGLFRTQENRESKVRINGRTEILRPSLGLCISVVFCSVFRRSIVILGLLALLSSPLFAQESYRDFEKGLNLSESQRTQVDSVGRKYMGEWRTLKDESMRRRLELKGLDHGRPDQRERAQRIERELERIESSRQRLFRQYRGEVSTVLNNEQRERFYRFTDRETRRPVSPPRYRTHGR
jgi:hypothetical protein